MKIKICTIAALCSLVVLSATAQVKPESILSRAYEGYLKKNACWTTVLQESGQKYCMKIDRTDKMVVDGVSRTYILATGTAIDDQGEENGSHASAGLVGAFVIEEAAGKVQLVSGDAKIAVGASGSAPTKWKFVKLGPANYWGWLNTIGDCHQGYCGSRYTILVPYGKRIRDVAGFPASADDSGACADKRCEAKSMQLESTLEIDSSRITDKVFPLVVTTSGKTGGRPVRSKEWLIPFNETKWQYVPPQGWPLKDAEF